MERVNVGLLLISSIISTTTGTDVINAVELKTPSGWVRGYEENYDEGQVYRFVKIPFAQPPTGKLRFQKPQPIGEWEGVEGISDENSPACPQWDFPVGSFVNLKKDENCLSLNIYVPGKISRNRNLSVMVWIYVGGFLIGGAAQYRPQKLVLGGDVIVVTINYRTGLLGFLTLNDPLMSGNYGLWDQIEALRWVQKNIAAFGGNPQSVTIFGESAGGMSVSLQTLIPSNEGLFHRAIAQSGVTTFFTISTRELERKTAALVLERTNCKNYPDVSETLKCLQEVPVENITYAITLLDMQKPMNATLEFGGMIPNVDGELIKENLAYPRSPDDAIYSFFRSIDFMSGTMDGEGNLVYLAMSPKFQEHYEFKVTENIPKRVLCEMYAPEFVDMVAGNIPELTREICDFYTSSESIDTQSNKVCEFHCDNGFIVPSNRLLSIHASNNRKSSTYQYLMTKPSPIRFGGDPPTWFKGAEHGDDLPRLFDFTIYVPEEKRKDIVNDGRLSADIVRYWSNFAKYGNPNGDTVPHWPSYDVSSKRYVILDSPITTGKDLKSDATALLSKIMEKGRHRIAHDEL